MIGVGIDVSKEKSTVCILRPYGEVAVPPYEISHTESEVKAQVDRIGSLALLRKTGYEHEMSQIHKTFSECRCLSLYAEKEAEGKPKRVAKVAALNKFLRIYYARAMALTT